MEDLAEAITTVRSKASGEWSQHLGENSLIGVMGFSAGGHLAAMRATFLRPEGLVHFMPTPMPNIQTHVQTSHVQTRPDVAILYYPLITMNESAVTRVIPSGIMERGIRCNCTHTNSRREMLGRTPSDALVRLYSAENLVSSATPPTLLVHARDDNVVPPSR